jgi:hypothetical protein
LWFFSPVDDEFYQPFVKKSVVHSNRPKHSYKILNACVCVCVCALCVCVRACMFVCLCVRESV